MSYHRGFGITNRAIVLAALGDGVVTLTGSLWSEDTEAMVTCGGSRLGHDLAKISGDGWKFADHAFAYKVSFLCGCLGGDGSVANTSLGVWAARECCDWVLVWVCGVWGEKGIEM